MYASLNQRPTEKNGHQSNRAWRIICRVILFERDVYPASAVALKNGVVYLLPKRQFYNILGDKAFRNDFIRMLMKKQRYLADSSTRLPRTTLKSASSLFARTVR